MFHPSKHSKTIKALGLRPRAFISFLVFGYPGETLALVFEILLEKIHPNAKKTVASLLKSLKKNIYTIELLRQQMMFR